MSIKDDALAKTTLLSGVDLTSIKPIIAGCCTQSLWPEQVLLRPDTANTTMYIIIKGQLSIHLDKPTDAPIAFAGVGECVGEVSVFDGQNPCAYVKAAEPTEVFAIPKATLWQLVEKSHPVACNLLRLLSQRVRHGNEAVNTSQRLQKAFERDANIDPLTGLFNRRWLDTYFKRILTGETFTAHQPDLAMLLVDADHFKRFNDEFGHHRGDVALKSIARSLQQNIRPDDIAARVGGEEFVLVFPSTHMTEARKVAERVRHRIQTMTLTDAQQSLPSITVSIGIAMMQPNDAFVDLFAAADGALYQAKAEGRNTVCVATRKAPIEARLHQPTAAVVD